MPQGGLRLIVLNSLHLLSEKIISKKNIYKGFSPIVPICLLSEYQVPAALYIDYIISKRNMILY